MYKLCFYYLIVINMHNISVIHILSFMHFRTSGTCTCMTNVKYTLYIFYFFFSGKKKEGAGSASGCSGCLYRYSVPSADKSDLNWQCWTKSSTLPVQFISGCKSSCNLWLPLRNQVKMRGLLTCHQLTIKHQWSGRLKQLQWQDASDSEQHSIVILLCS